MAGLSPENPTPHSPEEGRTPRQRVRGTLGIAWFRKQFPEVIHPDLTSVYRQYVDSLDPRQRAIRVENQYGTFVRGELADHLELGDDIGKAWAEAMYHGTFLGLSRADRRAVRSNPELLIQKTVANFQSAVDKRTSGSKSE